MCLLQEDTLLMQRASCSAYTAIRLPTTLMRARLNADIGERANVSSISAERYSDFGKQYTDYGKFISLITILCCVLDVVMIFVYILQLVFKIFQLILLIRWLKSEL